MRKGRFALVLLIPVALAMVGPAGSAQPSTALSNGITFSHAQVVDPFRLMSEPDIVIDGNGALYTSGPGGSASQQSTFWKSADGIQWHPVGTMGEAKQNSALGGGDTELALANDNTLFAADQEFLLCNAIFRSTDGGSTFTTGETCLPGTDRPWMAVYDPNKSPTGRRVYFAANQGALLTAASLGCYVNVSTDNGLTYTPATGTNGLLNGGGQHCQGHMAVDPTSGWLYIPTGDGVWKSTDNGAHFTNIGAPEGVRATLFANLASDSAGNIYYFWTTTSGGHPGPAQISVHLKNDPDGEWSTPVNVNTPNLKENVFPWIVAGDPGRVAMVYYGTTDTGGSSSVPAMGGPNAQWHLYANFSTDLVSCSDPSTCTVNPAPTFQQVQADEHVMHKGAICVGGFPNCLQNQSDRSMADFMEVAMDPRDGRVAIVYDDNADKDTANNIGKPIVAVTKERTGPSLLASVGSVLPTNLGTLTLGGASVAGDGTITLNGTHGLPAGNWAQDPTGDAKYPVTPTVGPNIPALDINEASAADDGANYTFKVKVADLSQQAQALAAQSVGAPSLLLMWWDKGAGASSDEHYYVKWHEGAAVAEYGKVGDVLWPALGAPAPKFLTYQPAGQATASVTGSTLTLTVPKSGVGAPVTGDKIDNVTAYGIGEKGPVPSVVDATPAFSYVVGTPAAAQHAPDGYVQISVDDPTFANATLAALSGNSDWSGQVGPLSAGSHTIYVRQVLSAEDYNPGLWDDVVAGPVVSTTVTIP